eukprot:CAMPEP_0197922910 /NCGR_PEP_ID=MMETSP1439-20131203/93063_1 /TAXON_ID=66791 /ORGANISM="Gonyaulax spinifera, Strain CCMP409" /LENGTH=68 /DNA_ID=CAMNT_0043545235 /DNA_START=41 /DNA_END=244 /DNA_ORIENTATION=+
MRSATLASRGRASAALETLEALEVPPLAPQMSWLSLQGLTSTQFAPQALAAPMAQLLRHACRCGPSAE